MTPALHKTLIYGYGNPGRQDDGLGVLLSEAIEQWVKDYHLNQLETDSNYQLNLEDAEKISRYKRVIFVDASQESDLFQFKCTPLHPQPGADFSMHAVSPAYVLHLCNKLFMHHPEAYLLHIKGYEWEFMKEVTPAALGNLKMAIQYIKQFCSETSC